MAADHDCYCKKTAVSVHLQAGRGATQHYYYGPTATADMQTL